ncbi:MAG: hypothetical protein AB8F78_01310 [Saprospiraceae bacterium]
MEHPARQHATVRLVTRLSVLFAIAVVFGLTACKPDAPVVAAETATTTPANNTTPASQSPGTVIDDKGVPSIINGKRVKSVEQVEGGIEPYQGDDPSGDGERMAIEETTANTTGFAGVNPCDVIKTQDLEGWPGGVGSASSERSNMGDVVLGCITTFRGAGNRPTGNISLYFSNNQSAELAQESVKLMPQTSNGSAKLITDWNKPAAYDPKTGEFVWAHNQVFITLLIAHPSVMKDNLKWSKKLASAVESRMP